MPDVEKVYEDIKQSYLQNYEDIKQSYLQKFYNEQNRDPTDLERAWLEDAALKGWDINIMDQNLETVKEEVAEAAVKMTPVRNSFKLSDKVIQAAIVDEGASSREHELRVRLRAQAEGDESESWFGGGKSKRRRKSKGRKTLKRKGAKKSHKRKHKKTGRRKHKSRKHKSRKHRYYH